MVVTKTDTHTHSQIYCMTRGNDAVFDVSESEYVDYTSNE